MAEFGRFLYGGDYNPDQWLDRPDILEEDIRLMKLASVNIVSLGIFAWASLEPAEGQYEFEWLDGVIERLHAAGISINLATPSGAKPNWMALKYPEIRRVSKEGVREPQNGRHNHCWTSPVYRKKVWEIDRRLSERYGKHPAVILWHLSNEYGGDCSCELCFDAFRLWLKEKYGTIDELNNQYWGRFWSHTFGDFSEVTFIDDSVNALMLDWQRFTSDRCVDFIKHETAAIRAGGSELPVVTNMMGFYPVLNYWDQADVLDYVSNDAYPLWHNTKPDADIAAETAFTHDLYRSMKPDRSWLLMESTPSNVNWQPVSRPKKPGALRLIGLQAVAHGSTSVMYFQWRKGRGGAEKFHGAIVDHVGDEHTRVFRETAALGAELQNLTEIAGARTKADVAVIYDWHVNWAYGNSFGMRNADKHYHATCLSFYKPLWQHGVAADVIESVRDFSGYKLIFAPMLYLLRPGVSQRLREFVSSGGTLVLTYESAQVNYNDLVYPGGFPGTLRDVFGIWVEESDAPVATTVQNVTASEDNSLGLNGTYKVVEYADILHLEGAKALGSYQEEWYAGYPAVTVNQYGSGSAYYVASRNDTRFQSDFVSGLLSSLKITGVLGGRLPDGVSATSRTKDGKTYTFVMNFNAVPTAVPLPKSYSRFSGGTVTETLDLPGYGCDVLVD